MHNGCECVLGQVFESEARERQSDPCGELPFSYAFTRYFERERLRYGGAFSSREAAPYWQKEIAARLAILESCQAEPAMVTA